MSITAIDYQDITNSTTTVRTANAYIPPLQPPTNISIPEFLKNYLMTTAEPLIVDESYLIALGKSALAAKVADTESFNTSVKFGKKSLPDQLSFEDTAILMMSLYTFRNIQMTENADDVILAMYDPTEGIYKLGTGIAFERMDRISPKFKKRDMEDVLDKIRRSVPSVELSNDRNLFVVKNGIYDNLSGKLHKFDPRFVSLAKIPIDYKVNPINPVIIAPDGFEWDVESWITDISDDDADTATLIWQVIADCLQPNHSRGKSIWFHSGEGNNGKGTVGQLIKNVLGKGNYSSLSVKDYNHEYLKSTLIGTAANIADENDVDEFIDSVKDYKASVTGDNININIKYEKPRSVQLKTANLQMMNGFPKSKDKSDSWYRRLILVPFTKSFTNNGERKYIKDDYIARREVLEYVLHKGLNMDFDEYIMPARSAKLMDEYKENNNPVLEFWNQLKDEFVWDLLPTRFLHDLYVKWYAQNNPSGKPLSQIKFTAQLAAVIASLGNEWTIQPNKDTKVRSTTSNMGADEPLITEYGLDIPDRGGKSTEWMKVNSAGTNPLTRRAFTRKQMYRGFERK